MKGSTTLRYSVLLALFIFCAQLNMTAQADSVRFNQAHRYATKGNFTAALPIYTKVIEKNPKNENAFRERGSCYMELNKFDESLADYNKAIEMDPSDGLAYENRGILYSLKKMNTEALADFKSAIRLDSCCATAYCSCGTLMLGMNKYDDAEKFFRMAIQVAPEKERPTCYTNLGYTYLLKGNTKRAIAHLSLAITLSPKSPEAYKYRSQAYRDIQNTVASEEDAAKYKKLSQKAIK